MRSQVVFGGGIYSDERHEEYNGWHIWTIKFQVAGRLPIYRWCRSKHADQKDKHVLWRDKNPLARRFDRIYFLERAECLQAALAHCAKESAPVALPVFEWGIR